MPDYDFYTTVFPVLVFDGFNQQEMWDDLLLQYPNMTVTASSSPSASATFTIVTDLPNNGPQTHNYSVGDGFSRIGPGYGYMSSTTLADILFVQIENYVDGRIAAAAPAPTLAVGYAVTPSLGIGASATVNVDMVPALPDSGYNVAVALAGSSQLLGALAILSATVAGSAQVDVVVQNNGLLTLAGATVLVTALHNG